MKRVVLPASALVLVVTACGAGAKPAPRLSAVEGRPPSVHTLVVQRKRSALSEARRMARAFVPPAGARSTREPRGYGGVLRRYGSAPLGEIVDVHRFWRVRKPLAAVAAFVRTHRPRGLKRSGATYGSNAPHYLRWSFSSPSRYLDVTAVALPGRTVLRVDALVLWIYPRSAGEIVPRGTREIVVTEHGQPTTVTSPGQVARIGRWFDALPVSPPGIAIACPLVVRPEITLLFRSAGGARLARATVPTPSAWICDPIGFTIGGKARRPLIDSSSGESFARRLQSLLRH
jgi:hypothetical protein